MMLTTKTPGKQTDLHEIIAHLRKGPAGRTAPRPLCQEAVDDLLTRIEHAYLIEFLVLGSMTLARKAVVTYVPGFERVETFAFEFAVEDERVVLQPAAVQSRGRIIFELRNERHEEVVDLCFDLQQGGPWTALVKERGFRRLVEPLLPERSAELDEALFRRLLAEALIGPQPVFLRGGSDLGHGIGEIVDRVTSGQVGDGLARAARSAAGHARHLTTRLLSPALRHATRRTLPTVRSPAALLLKAMGRS